jgi:hypothetical protein
MRFLVLSIACALSGCLPEPAYPDTPVLTFVALEPTTTEGRALVLEFTDGDGDVGLDSGDTLGVFCPTCEHHYNLRCEYEELRNGVWTPVELNPAAGQIPFYYRVPRSSPSGSSPAQNGTLSVDMPSWYLSGPFDTLRFRVKLWDRSLNASNEVLTAPAIKP